MTIHEWKDKAFEGGYVQIGFPEGDADLNTMLLSPEAWKAVGKVEGWGKVPFDVEFNVREEWLENMHRMIDSLAEGKTIEQYLETL